jgi:phage repressor protein C with HTH and peptisase S24 domain
MTNLATIPARPKQWLMEVGSDNMRPTLRPCDYVAVIATDAYAFPTLYVLEERGYRRVVRAQYLPKGRVQIIYDNPLYHPQELSVADFNDLVIGRVVGDVKVREPLWDHVGERVPA